MQKSYQRLTSHKNEKHYGAQHIRAHEQAAVAYEIRPRSTWWVNVSIKLHHQFRLLLMYLNSIWSLSANVYDVYFLVFNQTPPSTIHTHSTACSFRWSEHIAVAEFNSSSKQKNILYSIESYYTNWMQGACDSETDEI